MLLLLGALEGDDRSPGGMYWRMMMSLAGDTPGPSSSLSLSPEKRVNCFWVSSTILRALRSRYPGHFQPLFRHFLHSGLVVSHCRYVSTAPLSGKSFSLGKTTFAKTNFAGVQARINQTVMGMTEYTGRHGNIETKKQRQQLRELTLIRLDLQAKHPGEGFPVLTIVN